ncbi:restriction endonuclease [Leptospira yasudae]|uniref:restriction endonuclease n=1 Tax=Leptospira yasudae TaxID=2202201 RepID=UPI001C4F1C6F|nr:restriction endonuclease [Leptospira yasudae]MBW0436011.1 restriction endonuclease [Leptospira yasudae]
MDWKEYEEITKDIYQKLGEQAGVSIVGYGNNFKVTGKSNVSHQIDVLTSHSDGIHTYLTDIECKYWNQNIDKDIIMKVDSIVKDCSFNKGVVVSKLGFTPDAIAYAKSVNIGLVILREPTDADWGSRMKSVTLNLHMFTPIITGLEHKVTEVYVNLNGKNVKTDDYEYLYSDGNRKSIKNIIDDFSKSLPMDSPNVEIIQNIDLPENTFLIDKEDIKIAEVKAITISGKLISSIHNIEINAVDNVWLMMKSIFEEKTFLISKDKEIRDIT